MIEKRTSITKEEKLEAIKHGIVVVEIQKGGGIRVPDQKQRIIVVEK